MSDKDTTYYGHGGISGPEYKRRFGSGGELAEAMGALRDFGAHLIGWRLDYEGQKKPFAGVLGQRKAERKVAPSADPGVFAGGALPGYQPGSLGLVVFDVDGYVGGGGDLGGVVAREDVEAAFGDWGAGGGWTGGPNEVLVLESWSGAGWHVVARLPEDVDPMDVQIGAWEYGGLQGDVCGIWRWAALANIDAVRGLTVRVQAGDLAVVPDHAAYLLSRGKADLLDPPPPAPARQPEPEPEPSGRRRVEAYVAGAVEKAVAEVGAAAEGERNNTLNRAAYSLYRFVPAGVLTSTDWRDAMAAVGVAAGLGRGEVSATLASVERSPPPAWDGRMVERGPSPVRAATPAVVQEPPDEPGPASPEAEAEDDAELVVPIQFDAPAPDVLLQRRHDGPDLQAVLVRGDVAVITGPGKQGKTTFIAGLMLSAGMEAGGASFGLDVEPGRCLLVNMEDIPWSVARLYGHYGGADAFAHVGELKRPVGRLWEQSPTGSQAGASWLVMEKAIETFAPVYVVIDTVAHAFPAASPETVAEFIGNLRSLAARLNIGVLLVAHCTKSAQRRLAEGETWIDDSIVAGGAQWLYSPRAVLVVHKVGKPFREAMGADTVLVRCHYSNIGRPGWGIATGPRYGSDGGYRGLDLEPTQSFDDVEEYLDRLAKDGRTGAGVRAERLEALAGRLAAFCRPLSCPGAVAGSADLRLAYVAASNEAVNHNDFAEAMSLAGYTRSRTSRGSEWADLQLPGAG